MSWNLIEATANDLQHRTELQTGRHTATIATDLRAVGVDLPPHVEAHWDEMSAAVLGTLPRLTPEDVFGRTPDELRHLARFRAAAEVAARLAQTEFSTISARWFDAFAEWLAEREDAVSDVIAERFARHLAAVRTLAEAGVAPDADAATVRATGDPGLMSAWNQYTRVDLPVLRPLALTRMRISVWTRSVPSPYVALILSGHQDEDADDGEDFQAFCLRNADRLGVVHAAHVDRPHPSSGGRPGLASTQF